jgi:hypothetical protein
MSKQFLIFFGVGVVVIAVSVWGILYSHRGAHLELKGQILKIRTGALSDQDSIAVLDLRVENISDVPFVVRIVEVTVDKQDGSTAESAIISKMDLHQLFQFNRFLGDQYNDSLSLKDKIAPHQTLDRMVAARFDIPNKVLESAKTIHLSIQDVDGPLFETSKSLK